MAFEFQVKLEFIKLMYSFEEGGNFARKKCFLHLLFPVHKILRVIDILIHSADACTLALAWVGICAHAVKNPKVKPS